MKLETCTTRRLGGTFLALLASSLLALTLPAASRAAFPGANGRVAWESNQGGSDLEIMIGHADGAAVTTLTNDTLDDKEPAWSPDGKKIAYAHKSSPAGNFQIWTMNADGSGQAPLVTPGGVDATNPTWSRTGARIAYVLDTGTYDLYRADTSGLNVNVTPIIANVGDQETDPAYAPNSNNKIAFSRKVGGNAYQLWTVNDDGTSLASLFALASYDLSQPNWSPDGAKLAFGGVHIPPDALQHDLFTIDATGGIGSLTVLTPNNFNENSPAWSPEGNIIGYMRDAEIYTINPNGSGALPLASRPTTTDDHPDWQPVVAAQVRPAGATPIKVPLVPAFNECTSVNATHEPPFGLGSCSPPRASSSELTVGEPAVNGKSPNFIGSIKIKALAGDAQVAVSVDDVRCAHTIPGSCTSGPLSDYTGNMYLKYEFRLTDRSNPAGTAGTMQESVSISLNWPCTATGDPSVGSSCPATTTLNSIFPGLIVSGRRAVWRLKTLALRDAAGNDFAVPGTFYP